jgi:hypothetical protein
VRPEEDDRLDPGGTIVLKDGAIERLQIVADVLSKSLVLAHHEASSTAPSTASTGWQPRSNGAGGADGGCASP